jgi:hypothetical protein
LAWERSARRLKKASRSEMTTTPEDSMSRRYCRRQASGYQ